MRRQEMAIANAIKMDAGPASSRNVSPEKIYGTVDHPRASKDIYLNQSIDSKDSDKKLPSRGGHAEQENIYDLVGGNRAASNQSMHRIGKLGGQKRSHNLAVQEPIREIES
jgi:hypothetical protein